MYLPALTLVLLLVCAFALGKSREAIALIAGVLALVCYFAGEAAPQALASVFGGG